ncbi:PAS domain S-box protein, putative (macronuclear) [Tetrahymena thermophila SB210]|uniref:PAS domain S-box protein, putative n=1 Tax=Tetrahymena thermophila (strain SB210) TaxID=312017 RepID=Q23AV7_TETTS|nr:PAS domain S-box protein, putative [Tetrahymena thermophila SB210]EAR93727.2 PAS domain S-box protein, putative [Tetrahymena thermophila SB210]|eukprot:XP_001013972.2 PAS domain S-box protein, putative [Tetrahymena thermophila SB210]
MNIIKRLYYNFKIYYEKQICIDIHAFKRLKLISFFYLLIRLFWFILPVLKNETLDKLTFIDYNLSKLGYMNILKQMEDYQNVFNWIGIGINSTLILIFLARVTQYSSDSSNNTFQLLLSFFAQTYNYVLYIPLISVASVKMQGNPVAPINLTLSIIISFCIRIHDLDFSFVAKDFLGKKNPFIWDFVLQFLETMLIILNQFVSDPPLRCLFSLSLAIYTFIDSYTNSFYNNSFSRFYYLFFSTYHTLLLALLLISIAVDQQFPLSILILALIPISNKISKILTQQNEDLHSKYQNQYFFGDKLAKSSKKIQELDFFLRLLYQQIGIAFEDFRINKNSIILEKLSSDHKINCNDNTDCIFCNYQASTQEQFEQNFLDGKERKEFLKQFIRNQYLRVINSNSLKASRFGKSTFYFTYFYFLIEVEQSKVLGYVEIIRLNQLLRLSIRETAFLNEIFLMAKQKFEFSGINYSFRQTNKKSTLNSAGYLGNAQNEESLLKQEQNKLGNHSIENVNYFIGILFDEELNRVERMYYESLAMKIKVIKILSEDHIDLIEFKKNAIKLKQKTEQLQKDLQNLGNIHYNSHKVQYYMEGFALHLGFGEKKRRLFRKSNRGRANLQALQNVDHTIFDKDNCVVFISLIQSNLGIVKRVQNKFENIFGIQIKDIVGKSINVIIPSLIAKYHDKMIQQYLQNSSQSEFQQSLRKTQVENKKLESTYQSEYDDTKSKLMKLVQNNQQNIQKKIIEPNNYFSLLMARNSSGWGVPISLQFKIDCIGQSDCGITSHIKNIQTDYYYIMTNTRNFQIQLATQNIFDRLFSKYLQKSELQNICLNRIIPLLHYFEKLWVQGNNKQEEVHKDLVKTVAFMPKADSQQNIMSQTQFAKKIQPQQSLLYQKLEYQNLQKELQQYNLDQYDMFTVKMKFYHFKNSFVSYNIVEIQQIRRILSVEAQRENLYLLKNQFSALLNINFDISKELEMLQKAEQLLFLNSNINSYDDFKNFSMQMDDNNRQSYDDEQNQKFQNRQDLQQYNQLGFIPEKKEYINQKNEIVENFINLKKNSNEDDIYDNNFAPQIQSDLQMMKAVQTKKEYEQNSQMNMNHNSMMINQSSSLLMGSIGNINTARHGEEDYLQISYRQQQFNKNDKSYLAKQFSEQGGAYPELNSIMQALQYKQGDENISTQVGKSISNLNQNSKQDILVTDTFKDLPSTAKKNQNHETEENNHYNYTKQTQSDLQLQAKYETDQNIISPKQKGIYDLIKDRSSKMHNTRGKIIQDTQVNNTFSNISMDFPHTHHQEVNQAINQTGKQSLNSKQIQFLTSYYKTQPQNQRQDHVKLTGKKIQLEEEDIHFYGARRDKDGYSSDFFSNSAQQEEEKIKQELEQRSRILDVSSVKTSQSHNHEQKKNIQRLIKSNKKDISIILLNIFGYLAIITIAIITFYEFLQIQSMLNSSKEDIQLIPWANTMRVSLTNTIAFGAMADLIEFNGFQDSSLYNKTYIAEVRNRGIVGQKEEFNLLKRYYRQDISNKPYFQYINTNIMNFVFNFDDSVIPPSQNLKNIPSQKISFNLTVQHFLINFIANSYLFVNQDFDNNEQIFYQKENIDNFINFSTNMSYIQNEITLHSQNVLNQVESQQQTLMSLILIVSFTLISALFPLYYFVQYKNQSVLKLFATIPSQSLGGMSRSIQLAIDFQNEGAKLSKSKMALINNKDFLQRKRKNISSTSSLPKFKIGLFFICILAFVLIIIQPIVNYILIDQFNSEVQTNIKLLSGLYNLRAQMGSNMAVSLKYLVYILVPQRLVYNPPYYASRLKTLSASNSQSLLNVTQVINDSLNQKKSQQALYDNFFYELVNGNLCEAIRKYPQYVNQNNLIDLSTCSTVMQGILTKGFQIGMKNLFQLFADLHNILLQNNTSVIQNQVIQWQKTVNIKQFDLLQGNLDKTLIVIKDFLLSTMSENLQNILQIQIILLCFQIILLLVFFSIGWHTFLKYVYNEMIEIKQLLSIIQIDFIIDNPYIISYLTK